MGHVLTETGLEWGISFKLCWFPDVQVCGFKEWAKFVNTEI